MAQQRALDFLDQAGEIGPIEAKLRRGDAVVFDIGWDVFVVGIRGP